MSEEEFEREVERCNRRLAIANTVAGILLLAGAVALIVTIAVVESWLDYQEWSFWHSR